jgi:hypothetical protein
VASEISSTLTWLVHLGGIWRHVDRSHTPDARDLQAATAETLSVALAGSAMAVYFITIDHY